MMCARFMTMIFMLEWQPGFAVVLTRDNLDENHQRHEEALCTGVSDVVWEQAKCYAGQQAGEYLTLKVNSFDASTKSGSISVLASGVAPIQCERGFTKADQSISISDIEGCVSGDIETTGVRYCADQDHMIVDVSVGSAPRELVLHELPCPSLLVEEGSLNDLYSHSAWIWDSPTCTGNADPPADIGHCYTGSKMGEVVTIKIDSFASGKGSVLVTGSGLATLKCKRGFSKAEQSISVDRLEECLPKTVKPEGVKFCSDQNQYLLDAHVGMLSVEMALIPAPCPSFLLSRNSEEESVLEQKSAIGGPWDWVATTCTGSGDPPTHAPFCYSGSRFGETVTAKFKSFVKGTGSLTVAASGLKSVNCDRSFAKTMQMLEVEQLKECLPANVKPQGVKYCSDQNSIILDAHVGPVPIEMVMNAIECPKSFLEQEQQVVGQISASGVINRLVRSE